MVCARCGRDGGGGLGGTGVAMVCEVEWYGGMPDLGRCCSKAAAAVTVRSGELFFSNW